MMRQSAVDKKLHFIMSKYIPSLGLMALVKAYTQVPRCISAGDNHLGWSGLVVCKAQRKTLPFPPEPL
jgi:hypothetical protein